LKINKLESKINYERLLRIVKTETKRIYNKNVTPKGGVSIAILQSFPKREVTFSLNWLIKFNLYFIKKFQVA
jgi:hypothetical protein